ncbi:uncharacterized protein [Primulina huaijiensis]|uniref:uncharacterized protein n=1 Tax=Primulina huaijiensis TaxID=1492673 RepID=UPI003CC741DB
MWRVGNGSHINALIDCWIPSLFSGKSSMTGSSGLSKVQELISSDRTWNEVEVRSRFPSFEAECILDILLRNQHNEDDRFWKWGKKGKYTVKSGYLAQIGCFDPHESLSAFSLEKWWKKIWQLNIPQKLFECFNKSLSNLLPLVRHIWKVSPADFELFAMLAWAIWKEICILKHNSQIPNKCIKVEWILSYLEQFRTARCAWNLASGEVQSSKDMRCVPSPLGQWRLDVDVGFNDAIGKYSVSAVIRNHCGIIFATSAIGIRRPGSVLEAELSAIHFGLMLL